MFEQLAASWQEERQSSFAEYLALSGVIDRPTARTLEAMRKGYVTVPVGSLVKADVVSPAATRAADAAVRRWCRAELENRKEHDALARLFGAEPARANLEEYLFAPTTFQAP